MPKKEHIHYTLVHHKNKCYLPLTALKSFIPQLMKEAKVLSKEYDVPLEKIGVNLDKFHSCFIEPDDDLHIRLMVDEIAQKLGGGK